MRGIFEVKENHKVVYLRALTSDLICRRDCFAAMSSLLKCGKGNNAHFFYLPGNEWYFVGGVYRSDFTQRVMKSCYKIIVQ